jgi:hypothetical protein
MFIAGQSYHDPKQIRFLGELFFVFTHRLGNQLHFDIYLKSTNRLRTDVFLDEKDLKCLVAYKTQKVLYKRTRII